MPSDPPDIPPDGEAPQPAPEPTRFLMYNTEDGQAQVRVLVDGPAAWLSQKQIAELFETSIPNVNQHINNILEEGELDADRTIKNYLIVGTEGQRQVKRAVAHYNLPMILAVGFRVRSPRGTQFRRWAGSTLAEYMAKGFILDDARLKQANAVFGQDYFDELIERIRDIRASEKRFYQKITAIYATATDYDARNEVARSFFAKVQNKLEWAVTGKTGPEIIKDRANADQPRMGLTTWKNAPDGPVRKGDVTVAKNYLNQEELGELNRIVTMYLDFAEDQAKRQQPMSMAEWADKLDAFLSFTGRAVLTHAGKVKRKLADAFAHKQYTEYQPKQRAQLDQTPSDFDRFIADDIKRLEGDKGAEDE